MQNNSENIILNAAFSSRALLKAAFSSKAEDHFISDDNTGMGTLERLFWFKNTIAIQQADQLEELFVKRTMMCGIGTKRVKNFLAGKVKEGDKAAKILYTVLKAEDKRLSSLMCSDKYRTSSCNDVTEYLNILVNLIHQSKIGSFDYVDIPYSDCLVHKDGQMNVLLIDLPGDEQVGYLVPGCYGRKPFTGELKSTARTNLTKIEAAINRLYGNQIVEKYGSPATEIDVKLPNVIIKYDDECDVAFILEPTDSCKAAYQKMSQWGIFND
jgi:hypothetical protein